MRRQRVQALREGYIGLPRAFETFGLPIRRYMIPRFVDDCLGGFLAQLANGSREVTHIAATVILREANAELIGIEFRRRCRAGIAAQDDRDGRGKKCFHVEYAYRPTVSNVFARPVKICLKLLV
jgi:hypothetical protein